MSSSGERLAGPNIWSQAAQNPDLQQYKLPWEASVQRQVRQWPQKGHAEALLVGFALLVPHSHVADGILS